MRIIELKILSKGTFGQNFQRRLKKIVEGVDDVKPFELDVNLRTI